MSWQHNGPDLARPEAGDTVTLASDGDRDAAVRVLGEAFAEGRLTADEHGERVRTAYAARTRHELARLTADLPGAAQAAGPAATGVPDSLDRCLLCALLICCPPAGIAWLRQPGTRRRQRCLPWPGPAASRSCCMRGASMSQKTSPRPDGCRTEGLTGPARQVHQAVLAAFARTGQPPARSELERLARSLGASPGAVLAELAETDALAFNAGGEIRAAYPFSPVRTPIRVSWPGGPAAYAMCAVDALGRSAMLGRPVTITAAEPDTGGIIDPE